MRGVPGNRHSYRDGLLYLNGAGTPEPNRREDDDILEFMSMTMDQLAFDPRRDQTAERAKNKEG